jgi:hypothetical protein
VKTYAAPDPLARLSYGPLIVRLDPSSSKLPTASMFPSGVNATA